MNADTIASKRAARVWLTPESCDIEVFKREINRTTNPADYPFAALIESNVPIYDGAHIATRAGDSETRKAVMAEWAEAMLEGPGIVVFTNTGMDIGALDRATTIFNEIITEQHASGGGGGDHFAKPGANDRIWNALEKLALRDPECFARYYANDLINMVSEAWLGTGYQITSQLNVVNPGGEAQSAHRDYHMGFQTAEQISGFPAHAHLLSPGLTLQGAVAHCDMPVESGPTLYLPFSQRFAPGYFAWRKTEFKDYFNFNHVQLALRKGDMAFFNPALFHAAGHNKTKNIRRMANLLQVSSAYGRAMETVDRARMGTMLYPVLAWMKSAGELSARAIDNVIAAAAEGYSFPTNLDRDPPIGGLAPETQAALLRRALSEGMAASEFNAAVEKQVWRKQT